MKPLASNTLLQNRYLIVHLIGRGGMGEVYLAIDQRLGNAVALKRTAFFDNELLGNAFEREARTLARLRHNALPKVSDHFVEDGNQYLVMEYIAGDDLSKRLETSNKPFPVDWVMFWADRLLDALDYLHSNEPPIIHRDIKPQNLKLTEDNQIVLLDFGLSKNSADVASRASTTGSVIGYTPQYAPIEQIRGTGTNPRSDIYSLSSTLYQLLTNTVPPDALTRAEIILSEKPDPLLLASELNPQIAPAISAILLKGMAVTQDRRFSAASEMQRELREAFAQHGEVEKPAQMASSNPPFLQSPAESALKTTVVSNAGSSNSQAKFQSKANAASAGEARFSDKNISDALTSKPADDSQFARISNGESNGGAFTTSIPNRQNNQLSENKTSDFPAAMENEKPIKKKSALFFAGAGALVCLFAAAGFGFYIFNRTGVKTTAPAFDAVVISPPPPAGQPNAPTKPSETDSISTNEIIVTTDAKTADSTEEKSEQKPAADASAAKTVQPSSARTNQKPAQPSPESKNAKPAAKAAPKPERQPTPLPRILP